MEKLLLDMGLPRRSADDLRTAGWDVEHVSAIMLKTAPDEQILEEALRTGRSIVTLDSDLCSWRWRRTRPGPPSFMYEWRG